MNNEDLVLKMILDESGFTAGMNNAIKNLNKFDGQVDNTGQKGGRSLGGIWTSFVGNFLASGATKIISTGMGAISNSVDGAINRVDTLNNSNRVFENMGFNAQETSKTMDALKESINGLPTPLDSAIKGVQLIASSTNDLSKSEEIFSALNNGILGFGGSAEMVDNAIVQLSQSFSNGKVDAQTWNSMINSGLGPALNALAKQMGLTTGEMKDGLSDGTISVTQFQDALIDLNKNGGGGLKSLQQIASDSTSGIKTGVANAKTAIVRGVADVVTSLNDGLKSAGFGSISEIIANVGSKFESTLKKFAAAIPPMIKSAKGLYDAIAPFTPLIVGLASGLATLTVALKIQSTVNGLTAGFKAWRDVTKGATIAQQVLNSTLLANPFVAILAAVTGLAAGFLYLWKTNDKFRDGVIKGWNTIKDTIGSICTSIKDFALDAWDSVSSWASDSVATIKDAWNSMTGFFSDMWNTIKTTTSDVWTMITSAFTDYATTVLAPFEPMIEWFSNLWEQIKTISASSWEIIKSVILGPVLLMIDLVTGDFTQLKDDLSLIWTTIKDNASIIWNTLKDMILGYVKAVVDTSVNLWTSFKDVTINIWNSTIEFGKNVWDGFKNWLSKTTDNIVQGTVSKWNNLKQGTIDTFNNIKDGAKKAWDTMIKNVSDTVESIVGWFDKIKDINLFEAGKAIIDGFVDGLKSSWEAGKDFVGGIGGWIRDHKGPIEYDRKLLIPAGKAIMDGLRSGLQTGFGLVKKDINGVAGELNNELTDKLNAPTVSLSTKSSGAFESELPNTKINQKEKTSTSSGDTFNINLQSLGELSEIQLMRMAEQLVKYIKDVKDREDAPKGGAFGGI